MATIQSFSNLNAESTEDQMEMGTSPYPQFDDIDFDLDDDREPSIADNSMIDETTEHMPASTRDDNMQDGATEHDTLDLEEDDLIMDPEEDLFNDEDNAKSYVSMTEDPVLHPSHVEDSTTVIEDTTSAERKIEDDEEALIEEEESLLEEEATNNQEITQSTVLTANTNNHDSDQKATNSVASTTVANVEEGPTTTEAVDFAVDTNATTKLNPDDTGTTTVHEEASPVSDPIAVAGSSQEISLTEGQHSDEDDSTHDFSDAEQHHSPHQDSTATSLHPVALRYQGQDLSLFPPLEEDDSTTYFLEDSALAFETLDKLLTACRDLLGDSLGHDDEIVIDIPSLGLHICEDSRYAAHLTLTQVIDTYMLLSQNEHLSPIEPLHCELSHRVCLATQMAYLVQSAREGKTYSAIAAEHVDSPELRAQADEESGDTTTDHNAPDDFDGDNELDEATATTEARELNPSRSADGEEVQVPETLVVHVNEASFHGEEFYEADQEPDGLDGDLAEILPVPSVSGDDAGPHNPRDDDAASRSSLTLEGDHAETTHPEEAAPEDLEDDLLNDEGDYPAHDDNFVEENDAEAKPAETANATNGDHVHHEGVSEGHIDESTVQDEFNLDDFLDEDDDSATEEAPSPTLLATPSKNTNGKRKAMDDDDLLDIDLSTPEPKRTRAS